MATVNSCNFQAFVVKRTKKTIGVHFLGFEKWNDENIRVKDISSRVRKRSKFNRIILVFAQNVEVGSLKRKKHLQRKQSNQYKKKSGNAVTVRRIS